MASVAAAPSSSSNDTEAAQANKIMSESAETPAAASVDEEQNISYSAERIIGNGSFGVVFEAKVVETGEVVAIKKVLQDKRFKNRELQIMRQLVKDPHSNVVALRHCFYSQVCVLGMGWHLLCIQMAFFAPTYINTFSHSLTSNFFLIKILGRKSRRFVSELGVGVCSGDSIFHQQTASQTQHPTAAALCEAILVSTISCLGSYSCNWNMPSGY